MPPEDAFVELPPEIRLSLDEVATVLEALDVAEAAARTGEERASARAAIRLITAKVWPELGDLLGPEDEE